MNPPTAPYSEQEADLARAMRSREFSEEIARQIYDAECQRQAQQRRTFARNMRERV